MRVAKEKFKNLAEKACNKYLSLNECLVFSKLFGHVLADLRSEIPSLHICGGLWDLIFESRAHLAFIWVGNSGQEIWRTLSLLALETELFKVLLGFVGGSEIHANSFVEHHDFVKYVVHVFRSLIKRSDGGTVEGVAHDA